jgi:hypothetical protein
MMNPKEETGMDIITVIVTPLAAGAAAGLKPTAERVITDAYAGLKALIQGKYAPVDLTALENRPESATTRTSVAGDLAHAGAAGDQELLTRAKALIDAVEQYDRETMRAIGVDLEEVKAAYLKVQNVTAEGTGVQVRKAEFTEGIDIREVQAGQWRNSPNA